MPKLAPNSVTEPRTPFSAKNMNHIEQGIADAHDAIEAEAQARLEYTFIIGSNADLAAWIGVLSLAKAFWGFVSDRTFGLSMQKIITSGVVIAAVFSPVYLTIVLDKIKNIKVG